MVQYWNIGMVEYWNGGIVRDVDLSIFLIPVFQYSIIPFFHFLESAERIGNAQAHRLIRREYSGDDTKSDGDNEAQDYVCRRKEKERQLSAGWVAAEREQPTEGKSNETAKAGEEA